MPRFKRTIFCQNRRKIKLLKKTAKFQTPTTVPPPIANFWLRAWQLCTVHNYRRFRSFCLEEFFLDGSDANLMMLTADVCRKLNCFFFEKFYLHFALCDFDSIL